MNKRLLTIAAVLLLILATVIALDQLTVTRPQWPEAREGGPVPPRPGPGDAPFHTTPLAPTLEERRALFLDWVAAHETADDRGGLWTDMAKLARDPQAVVNPNALQAAIDHVNSGQDTGDFTMAGLMRLYHQFGGRLSPEQRAAIEQAILDFKYWLDEPNPVFIEMWTENHQILSHSAEYLAGQLFPEAIFANNGQTGAWRQEHARQKILDWIDWRARTGMAEWDSVTYYRMDIAALLNLADFAQEEQIASRAAMLVDLLLFDVAVDSFYGQYGTSHGRATPHSLKSAAGDSMETLQALAWGLGRFQSAGDMGAISLAISPSYRIPPVVEAVAQDTPEAYVNFERHAIPLTDEAAAAFGLSFDDFDDMGVWWGMGAFTHPKVIDLTVTLADAWDLWHYPDFRDLKDLAGVLQRAGLLSAASALLDPDPNGVVMSEVNKVTYRTLDTMLSSAQDYRKGEKGYQQHVWQATLGPYAVVFVTNPDSLIETDRHRPNYWAGNGRMPRTGQHENVLISLFDIDRRPSPSIMEARHYAFTHAYFPRWAFDEVVEVPAEGGGGWIFGRKGEGYIGLYSREPYEWQTEGPDAGQEVIALGRRNVWIAQLGRAAVDGSFQAFMDAVSSAPLAVRGLHVEFASPGNGLLTFGWDDPLTLDGQEIPLRGYDRWQNPYADVPFDSRQFTIEHAGHRLELDFLNGTRKIEP